MSDLASSGAGVHTVMLDALCDALGAAIVVYDRNDHIIFASRKLLSFFPLEEAVIGPGARLRDYLGALYDCYHIETENPAANARQFGREEWIGERLALHWKERSEKTERLKGERFLRFVMNRLPSGLGISVLADISEQKKREEQWRIDLERVQLLEDILDNLPFPVFVKDRNLAYAAVNKSACTLVETSPESLLGRTVFDLHSSKVAGRIDAADRTVLESGTPSVIPERVRRLNGEEILTITRKQRVGRPGRYFLVTTMEDVTALATLDANGMPVIPSLEHVAFVSSTYGKDEEKEGRNGLLKSKAVLVVSENSRFAEAAGRQLTAGGMDHAAVTSEEEQRTFIDVAASAGVAIDVVVIDAQMSIACLDIAAAHHLPVVSIEEDEIDASLLHHVAVGLHSVPKEKSVEEDWEIMTQDLPKILSNGGVCDVLLVEDNRVNQIVFSQILEGLGLSWRLATSGEEALRLFVEQAPSVVLLDTTLADIDGFEVARRMRDLSGEKRIPVVGVITHAFEGDLDKCLASGMEDMLLKPVSPDMVEAVFVRLFGKDVLQLQA
ncbi:Two component sensor kinase [Rhizobium sp. UR51a]|nr:MULTISPECIES: response regulator [Agrobacterium]KIV68548.1 Two component sensor kinase [Rhizobium sp. UR51a]MDP9775434.1 PAS domain S-box-containing protein [Rhizobium sp. SORGH_AS_0755]MBA8799751.1 PAS domain S-box-containing protein [Agrobacterium sp. RC10-4-1]MBP2610450.1 PAS domain S-box-containing protein [Agrobacterium pusense]MCZ7925935.1 response regulator [Agrobacterium pusense]